MTRSERRRDVAQSYVGGTKRTFLVLFTCMNWRPKQRRQGAVRAGTQTLVDWGSSLFSGYQKE